MDKLAFFGPNGKRYTLTAMPFGPKNAPTFYTMITRMIQEDATSLFKLLSNGVHIDLDLDVSLQPDLFVSNFSRADDFAKSCTGKFLPTLAVIHDDNDSNKASSLFINITKPAFSEDGSLTIK